MRNIQILGTGMSNGRFIVHIVVKATGKEFLLTGVKAERLARKYGSWQARNEIEE